MTSNVSQVAKAKSFAECVGFGRLSAVDIWASLKIAHDNLDIFLIVAGMTPVISAATAHDDAPWAAMVYAEFEDDEKLALRSQVALMKDTDPNLITHFNRCGYILAGLASKKTGAWILTKGHAKPSEIGTWWPPIEAHIASLPATAKAIAEKKLASQREWCNANPTNLSLVLTWI
jgi:hypothetical protein